MGKIKCQQKLFLFINSKYGSKYGFLIVLNDTNFNNIPDSKYKITYMQLSLSFNDVDGIELHTQLIVAHGWLVVNPVSVHGILHVIMPHHVLVERFCCNGKQDDMNLTDISYAPHVKYHSPGSSHFSATAKALSGPNRLFFGQFSHG